MAPLNISRLQPCILTSFSEERAKENGCDLIGDWKKSIVAISEGQSHFFKGCPSKDLRISIVVPPMDFGYTDHNYMEMY